MRKDAIFSLIVGTSMILMWVFLLITGQVPELDIIPIETMFSIVADNGTAVLLLLGWYGITRKKSWGRDVYLISMGALFYSLMIAIGYYSQLGETAMLGMFVPIFIVMMYSTYMKIQGK